MIVIRLSARFPLRFLLALGLGAVHALAFLDDVAWPLEILGLAALFALVSQADRSAAAARLGFAFGLGWFLVGISWVYVSMHTYGLMPAPLAAAATFAFCAGMALYPAFACGVASFLARWREPRWVLFALLPPLWCVSEMLRGWLLTGFPWLAAGYAHVASPLAGYASWIGVYGTGLAAAMVAAALAALAQRVLPRSRARALALAIVVGVPLLGATLATTDWSTPVGKPLRVRLLQGNIAQDVKFDPQHFESTVRTYFDLIERHDADLIVLPETALPRFVSDLPDSVLDRIRTDTERLNANIAIGLPVDDAGRHFTNSVLAFSPGSSRVQRYDKSHLVPFGEFVPYGFHWFIALLDIPLGDFDRGASNQPPMTLAGQRVAFDICYEDLFGEEIIGPAASAGLLVNVSNVAWFGDSMALPQHLAIARMRAIETARPMLRATNTGMTAAIDSRGKVFGVLKPFTTDSLEVTVQATEGLTPYVRAGNAGPWALALVLVIVTLVFSARSRSRP